jgi:hypothetical protein
MIEKGDFSLIDRWAKIMEAHNNMSKHAAYEIFSWCVSLFPRWQNHLYWDKMGIRPIALTKEKFDELKKVDLPNNFPLNKLNLKNSIICVDNGDVSRAETYIKDKYGVEWRINYCPYKKCNDAVYLDLCISEGSNTTLGESVQQYLKAGDDPNILNESMLYAKSVINILALVYSARNIEFEKEEFNETRVQLLRDAKRNKAKLQKHESFYFTNLCNVRKYTSIGQKDNGQGVGSGSRVEHVRGGHWHTYRIGKGRKTEVLLWVNPTVVNRGSTKSSSNFVTLH